MTDLQPWTWREFMAAMRKAGYKGMGQGCYVHTQTERKYYAWDWYPDIGEDWHRWAEVQQTPPPF